MSRGFMFFLLILAVGWAVYEQQDRPASNWSDSEKENAVHFIRSERAAVEMVRISNRGPAFSFATREEFDRMQELAEKALREARKVRAPVLEKIYPGMSEAYQDFYLPALEMTISGIQDGNMQELNEGGTLINRWVDWIQPKKDEIRIPKP